MFFLWELIFCFVFFPADGSKPSKRRWSLNSNQPFFLQQWSHIAAPEPVERQLTTLRLISGRGSPAQEGLRMDCLQTQTQTHCRTTDCTSLPPSEELDTVSLNKTTFYQQKHYWRSAPPAEVRANGELQLWVKGQVQKHVCGSETKQLWEGPFKALSNLRKSEASGWFFF